MFLPNLLSGLNNRMKLQAPDMSINMISERRGPGSLSGLDTYSDHSFLYAASDLVLPPGDELIRKGKYEISFLLASHWFL